MNFKFLKLKMENFKRYVNTEIDLTDVNLIEGPNSAGKTSIADAIAYAVTGKSFVGESTNLKFHNDKFSNVPAVVTLEILDMNSGTVTEIRRELSTKGNSKVYLDGKGTTQKKVAEIFPPDLFLSIFSKEYFQSLGDEKMRKLIEEYTEKIEVTKVLKKLSEDAQNYVKLNPSITKESLKQKMKELNKTKTELKNSNKLNVGKIEELQSLEKTLSVLPEKPTKSIDEKLLELSKQRSLIEGEKPTLLDSSKLEAEVSVLKNEMSVLEKKEYPQVAEISIINEKIKSINEFIARPYQKKRAAAIKIYKDTKSRLEEYLIDLKKLKEALFKEGDTCPHCSSSLTSNTSSFLNKEKLEEGKKLDVKIDGINKELEVLAAEGKKAALEDENHEKELSSKTKELEELQKTLKLKEEELDKAKEESRKLWKELNEKLKNLEGNDILKQNKDIESKFLEEKKKKLEEIDETIKSFNTKLKEIVEFNALQQKGKDEKIKIANRIKKLEESIEKEDLELEKIKKEEDIVYDIFSTIAKYQRAILRKKLDLVDIELEKVNKTTGEVEDIFKITYNGRLLQTCSFSETIKAGIEISNLLIDSSGYNFPVFIDCAGEIIELPRIDANQYFTARAVDQQVLEINKTLVAC